MIAYLVGLFRPTVLVNLTKSVLIVPLYNHSGVGIYYLWFLRHNLKVFMPVRPYPRFGLVVYLAKEIDSLYEDAAPMQLPDARLWRSRRTRELAVARKAMLKDFHEPSRFIHKNLSTIHCIFASGDQTTVIYEYAELRLSEFPTLTPLTEIEIAIAMSQV